MSCPPKDFSHFFPVRWCKSTRLLAAGMRCGRLQPMCRQTWPGGSPSSMGNGKSWKNRGKIMGKYENIPQKLMILMGKSSINWVGLSSHVWWPEGISRLWNLLGIRTECFSVYFFWGEPERSIPGKVAIAQKWHTNESKKLLAKGCRAI